MFQKDYQTILKFLKKLLFYYKERIGFIVIIFQNNINVCKIRIKYLLLKNKQLKIKNNYHYLRQF